jgi:hypothetical protein
MNVRRKGELRPRSWRSGASPLVIGEPDSTWLGQLLQRILERREREPAARSAAAARRWCPLMSVEGQHWGTVAATVAPQFGDCEMAANMLFLARMSEPS